MRFDLRLHGVTAQGQKCQADISVYAVSSQDLQRETEKAGASAAWYLVDDPTQSPTEGTTITVERVEQLERKRRGTAF